MVKIIRGFFYVFFLVIFFTSSTYAKNSDEYEMQLYAKAAVLMDGRSGRVLYQKNADEIMPMASTTKILTCILVLELTDKDEILSVSSYAATMPKVKLYMKKGEQYRVEDLLYSLMLESHNDSAVALAEYIGKQFLDVELQKKDTQQFSMEESQAAIQNFARLMNEKAVKIGCEDSWFITPNGLDASQEFFLPDGQRILKEHTTTAKELARILSYCILESPKKDDFLKITQTKSYQFMANNRYFTCNNHNAFLEMMEGAITGKTGFTNKAGYCYVGAVESQGRYFVVALLACGWPNNKTYKWKDTRKLMQYGMDQYTFHSYQESLEKSDRHWPTEIEVENARAERFGEKVFIPVQLKKEGKEDEGLLITEGEQIDIRWKMETKLTAPVWKNDKIGEIHYMVGNEVFKKEDLVLGRGVEERTFIWCLKQMIEKYSLLCYTEIDNRGNLVF